MSCVCPEIIVSIKGESMSAYCCGTGMQCHAGGSTALVHSARYQEVISVGSQGELVVLDLRQRSIRHTQFAGHQSPITCISMSYDENYFVTGSLDGYIKVLASIRHAAVTNQRIYICFGLKCLLCLPLFRLAFVSKRTFSH